MREPSGSGHNAGRIGDNMYQICSSGQGGEIYKTFEEAAKACRIQQRKHHVSLHVERVGAYCPTCGKDWTAVSVLTPAVVA